MIRIQKSAQADTSTCDPVKVTQGDLFDASRSHIEDVEKALAYLRERIYWAGRSHDNDKLASFASFFSNFQTGFKQRDWLDSHYAQTRHHINNPEGVRDNVNLLDVLEFIADWVMAGLARSGKVREITLPPALLEKAFQNTVKLLAEQVTVED